MTGPSAACGLVLVVSAPSGAGKTSVLRGLFKRRPALTFSVSATTRPRREAERDGVDYHFMSDEEFDRAVAHGEFAEWAVVHGNRYGTLKSTIDESVAGGATIMLDTDTVGAFNIRKTYPDAVLVFILPPSMDVLRTRLENRRTESAGHIAKRLSAVPAEIVHMREYDYIIVNDDIEAAVSQLDAVIEAESLKSGRVVPTLDEWRSFLD